MFNYQTCVKRLYQYPGRQTRPYVSTSSNERRPRLNGLRLDPSQCGDTFYRKRNSPFHSTSESVTLVPVRRPRSKTRRSKQHEFGGYTHTTLLTSESLPLYTADDRRLVLCDTKPGQSSIVTRYSQTRFSQPPYVVLVSSPYLRSFERFDLGPEYSWHPNSTLFLTFTHVVITPTTLGGRIQKRCYS